MFNQLYQRNKKYLVMVGIAIGILAFPSIFWLTGARITVTKASFSSSLFSVENSYLFVTPLQAKADGEEQIRLTIFILNDQGLGVSGRKVSFDTSQNLTIKALQDFTDSYGKAEFDISSKESNEYYLIVKVDGTALNQKAHLSFIK